VYVRHPQDGYFSSIQNQIANSATLQKSAILKMIVVDSLHKTVD
jgi:hypothetical protein